jgi:hypothetical protein
MLGSSVRCSPRPSAGMPINSKLPARYRRPSTKKELDVARAEAARQLDHYRLETQALQQEIGDTPTGRHVRRAVASS